MAGHCCSLHHHCYGLRHHHCDLGQHLTLKSKRVGLFSAKNKAFPPKNWINLVAKVRGSRVVGPPPQHSIRRQSWPRGKEFIWPSKISCHSRPRGKEFITWSNRRTLFLKKWILDLLRIHFQL